MTSILRAIRGLWRSNLWPESLASRKSSQLTTADPIEEETLSRYSPHRYYPVHLGESLNDRYLVIAKLGYGMSSTVWLAKDLQAQWWQRNHFVTLKILTDGSNEKTTAKAEIEVSHSITMSSHREEGTRYLRTVLDSFELTGPDSTHVGLVYAPMRESISKFQQRLPNGRMPLYFVKPLLAMILTGLDHLHSRCHIIHTDLKPDNILLEVEEQKVIDDVVEDEAREPTPLELTKDRAIYLSRNFGDLRGPPGRPKISDFGLAVRGDNPQAHCHPIQPPLFQAPEVILGLQWSYSADIWNLGVMLWNLVENRSLFEATEPHINEHNVEVHLIQIADLLGPAPVKLLERGGRTTKYLRSNGIPLASGEFIRRKMTLEASLTSISREEKLPFLNFVSRMLRWLPEDRATAEELLKDPWLTS